MLKLKKRIIKWTRIIALLLVMAMLFIGYLFSQFNFPYYSNEKLAALQAKLGLHTNRSEASWNKDSLQIIGHRGSGLANIQLKSDRDKKLHPIGNTESSIRKAIDSNVDWIEIDLRSSKTGVVLFHDATVDQKSNIKGPITELDDEDLRLGKLTVDPPEPILTIDDFEKNFLEQIIEDKMGLIFDIKAPDIRNEVLSRAESFTQKGMHPEKIIIFGEYKILKQYVRKGVRLGYTLTGKRKMNQFYFLFNHGTIIDRLKQLNTDLLVIPVFFTNRTLLKTTKKSGIEVWMYGSDDQRDWQRVSDWGVSGLIIDYPMDIQ